MFPTLWKTLHLRSVETTASFTPRKPCHHETNRVQKTSTKTNMSSILRDDHDERFYIFTKAPGRFNTRTSMFYHVLQQKPPTEAAHFTSPQKTHWLPEGTSSNTAMHQEAEQNRRNVLIWGKESTRLMLNCFSNFRCIFNCRQFQCIAQPQGSLSRTKGDIVRSLDRGKLGSDVDPGWQENSNCCRSRSSPIEMIICSWSGVSGNLCMALLWA